MHHRMVITVVTALAAMLFGFAAPFISGTVPTCRIAEFTASAEVSVSPTAEAFDDQLACQCGCIGDGSDQAVNSTCCCQVRSSVPTNSQPLPAPASERSAKADLLLASLLPAGKSLLVPGCNVPDRLSEQHRRLNRNDGVRFQAFTCNWRT